MSDDDLSPSEALAALDEARAAWMRRPPVKSWRYDVPYGLLAGFIVGGQALPVPLNVLASGVGALGIAVLANQWARVSGVWINGITPRRARWVSIALGLVAVVAAISVFVAARNGMAWVGWPAGLAMAGVAMAAARLWRWIYRSDTADGTDTAPDSLSRRPHLLLFGLAGLVLAAGAVAVLVGGFSGPGISYTVGVGIGVMIGGVLFVMKRNGLFGSRR